MGLFQRAHDIVQAKASRALDKAEKPDEMLDLSYEKMLEQITQVRRALVEIAASRKRIELQEDQLQHSADHLQDQAKAALGAGREELAREALTRRAAAMQQIEQMEPQHQQLIEQEGKLAQTLSALQTRVNQFRTQKETMKAQYTAAQAMTSVSEGVAGISKSITDSGATLQRAQDKIAGMQARSSALDELLESGVLESVGSGGDDIQKELDRIGAASSVDRATGGAAGRYGTGGRARAGEHEGSRGRGGGRRDRAGRKVMTDAGYDLELAVTTLITEAHDVHALLKVLTADLSASLGDRLQVERKGGLIHRSDEIKSVRVRLGDEDFDALVRDGGLDCTVAHSSGGIRIRTERLDMGQWLHRLLVRLQAEAARSQEARLALERLVIGGSE